MLVFDAVATAQLDRAYQGREFVRRRHANIAALDPRPGQTVLDLGCGNGMLLPELARALGRKGRVIGVDMSPDMLTSARARIAEAGEDWVEILDGRAEAIPLDDATADSIISIQVFEYIPDIPAALAECHRVLRPGGRLVIGDIHWGTMAWASEDPDRMARVLKVWDGHLADPAIPEHLPGLLDDAGFRLDASHPVVFTDTGPAPDGTAVLFQLLIRQYVSGPGGLPAEEASAWSAELDTLAASRRYFYSLTHFITVATRV
ncbi:methyltransferase domain-containing protein [Gordonia rhizosphera]|uniref:Putative methyltransferase n=1 Tax=Gordonia rhizosphera NBRC 16068 TaxID=1108045 RepID=K6WTY9_9ACTN|nr:methyltransferase domain-containing protein [Gordonia rhizosphera]GAB90034.1 putative methyltransferase [Gordonia rhizosphera NBRC 16068]